jgi:hypothetical protein
MGDRTDNRCYGIPLSDRAPEAQADRTAGSSRRPARVPLCRLRRSCGEHSDREIAVPVLVIAMMMPPVTAIRQDYPRQWIITSGFPVPRRCS